MAIPIAAVLFVLAGVHVYWALGGTWGGAVAVPTRADGAGGSGEAPLFRPGPVATLLVAAALTVAGLLVLAAGGAWAAPVPAGLVRAGAWGLAAVFALRAVGEFRYVGLFKRVRGTPFAAWDSRLFTPLCAALALGVAWIAARG